MVVQGQLDPRYSLADHVFVQHVFHPAASA
jgi:hypothetical protein